MRVLNLIIRNGNYELIEVESIHLVVLHKSRYPHILIIYLRIDTFFEKHIAKSSSIISFNDLTYRFNQKTLGGVFSKFFADESSLSIHFFNIHATQILRFIWFIFIFPIQDNKLQVILSMNEERSFDGLFV